MNLYALDLISLEKTQYNANVPDKLSRSITSDIDELSRADHRLIKMLWTDLFRSNINWMNGGYLHKECNDFMDRLLIFIQSNNIFIKESQIMDLEIKRKQTIFKINKHKFIC